jgi:uncharacterized membrane protein
MKKIFALLAIFAFIGVVSTPATANVSDNINQTTQIVLDNDSPVVADQDQDQDKKKRKTKKSTKVTKATAKSASGCGSVKAGCGEASEGCGSACGEKKAEGKKETKKKKTL